MKSTIVTRQIDDLGRISIPKDVRRALKIREGDMFEVFYSEAEQGIMFKKYSALNAMKDFASNLCKAGAKTCGVDFVITDKDKIIAASRNNIPHIGMPIHQDMIFTMSNRTIRVVQENEWIYLDEDATLRVNLIVPVIINGNSIGAVVAISNGTILPSEDICATAQMMANFLATQVSNY